MRLIDSHCHLQFPQYNKDRDAVIRRALDSSIGMICVGTNLETSRQAIELSEKYEGIWVSVGLHPNDNIGEAYDGTEYERLASSHPKVVAIGEIGLDYYRTTASEAKAFQKERFLKQLDLAARLTLPVIIHCRDAHEDMTEILQGRDIRGVIHSFTGTAAQAKVYMDNGFFIGFNGIVTFTDTAQDRAVITVPLERILLETDAPFLTPVPYRGKRNEPSYVIENARKIADIRGKSEETLISITKSNTCKLFNIPI